MLENKYIVDVDSFMRDIEIDREMAKELYQVVLSELEKEKSKAIQSYTNKDYLELKNTLHKIKGIAANYKIISVREIAQNIENDIKINNYDELEAKINTFSTNMDTSLSYIRDYFYLNGGQRNE